MAEEVVGWEVVEGGGEVVGGGEGVGRCWGGGW